MTGYSQRTLAEKLGIKEGWHILFVNPPSGYSALIQPLPDKVVIISKSEKYILFIQIFAKTTKGLEKLFVEYKQYLSADGMVWISWPKGSSKTATDLTENIVREIGLKNGLVDVKVMAIDNIWSGLKFVYRLKDR